MGPSGSGKTTLLDLLAGRKTVGEVQGSIRFAGQKASQQFLRRYTGYVEQFGGWPRLRAGEAAGSSDVLV
jgi:ABC-type multidrug transport system ATPase subunit